MKPHAGGRQQDLYIASDIGKAHTLPSFFYRDEAIFAQVRDKVLASTWLYVADATVVARPGDVYPFTLLEGVLDEPLVLTRTMDGRLRCLSNVCTHRGKEVVGAAGNMRQLRCGYHGRCFDLDGRFLRMPQFAGVSDFPTPADNLASIPVREWMGLVFVSLEPAFEWEDAIRPLEDRIRHLPTDTLVFTPEGTTDYQVSANWALYCDNYLEGFHIPFVHPALNQALDFGAYTYELFPYGNLQVGIADADAPCFDLPPDAPDAGKRVYAWYYWLFPNTMFNFYPWGLSLNIVEPLDIRRTRIRFRSYRFPDVPFSREENQLDQTEWEDEAVVESVQRGIRSRYYQRGRFSPSMEQGVHHFHRLLSEFLQRP
ncbi:MAG: hypothetical protein RLY31_2218 [Bacteroidota bacterium]|jgi:choline monooxygenase